MTAVLTRARAELRTRFKPMIALTLLVAIGAAAVMILAAGARRTDTAYPRFARAYDAADMLVNGSFGDATFANLDFNKVAALPQVAASAVAHFIGTAEQNYSLISFDPGYGVTVDRYKILKGRLPLTGSTDEALVSFSDAKTYHWHVGTLIKMTIALRPRAPGQRPTPLPMTFRVVGIEATPGEFPPQIGNNNGPPSQGVIHVGPALYQEVKDKQLVFSFSYLLLRLKHGNADVTSVINTLNQMAAGKAQASLNLNAQAGNVQRSIHLQAVALWIVAALVALIIVLIMSQLLARQATLDSNESPTLLALGMTRTQIWVTGMGRAAVIGLAGAAIAAAVAFFASPLMPIGTAGIAEPRPGYSFDAAVLTAIAGAVVALVLLLASWPIWKSTRATRSEVSRSAKPSLAARTAAAPGFPPPVSTGVRLALETGRGPTQVPVRSSLFSVILAIVALAGALTFGAGLDHLLSTPRQYGWNWDVHLTTNDAESTQEAVAVLKVDPRVEDVANIDTPPALLDGKVRFDLLGLYNVKGAIEPVLLNGHVPELPDEIALGVKTLRDVRAHIGGVVTMSISAIQGPSATFKVVGTVVLPPSSDTARLGSGAVITRAGTERMAPPGFTIPAPSDLYFNFAPGVNKKAALANILAEQVTVRLFIPNGPTKTRREPLGSAYGVLYPSKPTDLVNFGQVQNLPLLLAGLVGLLAAATLAHTLVTSIRRRRRDLAILKMLGFVPSQVRWAVAPWQATTFVSTALLIGIPAGIAVGRVVWSAFATNLGTLAEPVTPSVKLLLTIAGAIVLANLIAITPAVIASRMRPAPALRAE